MELEEPLRVGSEWPDGTSGAGVTQLVVGDLKMSLSLCSWHDPRTKDLCTVLCFSSSARVLLQLLLFLRGEKDSPEDDPLLQKNQLHLPLWRLHVSDHP